MFVKFYKTLYVFIIIYKCFIKFKTNENKIVYQTNESKIIYTAMKECNFLKHFELKIK